MEAAADKCKGGADHDYRDIWLWSRKLDDYDYYGSQCRLCGEMINERGAGKREFNIEWRVVGE